MMRDVLKNIINKRKENDNMIINMMKNGLFFVITSA